MDVYVDKRGVYRYRKHAGREFVRRNVGRKRLLERRRRGTASYISAVYEEVFGASVSAHVIGRTDNALDLDTVGHIVHLDGLFGKIASEDRIYDVHKRIIACRLEAQVAVDDELERNIGARKRELFHYRADRRRFRRVALQELTARRDVRKKLLDDDRRAVRASAFLAGNDMLCTSDGAATYKAIYAAVLDGRSSESRLNESVLRILDAKIEYGILG